jgi:flagellar motility protein MotE (MotC chaperone)
MKKVAIIAGLVVVAIVLFLVSFAMVVKMRGGLGPSGAALARLPLVGGLFAMRPEPETEEAAEPAAEQAEPLPGDRDMPYLRFGPPERLKRLVDELQTRQADLEMAERELERRSRELDAWERQLKTERDALRARFTAEKDELVRSTGELAQRQAALDARQVLVEQTEEANIKKTADIYSKMTPEKSSEVLAKMYSDGEQETVVKIIYMMQERSAAKTLEAMTDPQVSAEITQALKRVGKEEQLGG